ncbi:inositol monophosphatase family protein [Undibacterium sp. TJN19]|uniref:inositol monophosphatase family protein n=1 Tax=Undibacterium sp. TJN19 TaxID=3413055 RepID=UPI003BEFCB29
MAIRIDNHVNDNELIRIALDAVLAATKIADGFNGAAAVSHKGSLRDIVTQADIDISELLIKRLSLSGLPVISEENPDQKIPVGTNCWVVDPIDGTVNFSHGLPQYAVSVGLLDNGSFRLGVVCAPALNELYFTLNTERALMNGRPFRHEHLGIQDALTAASFSARVPEPQYTLFRQVNESTRGCLRTGSAALNICWAATGKLQAAYGFAAKIWDVAGALAIARAAGCEIQLQYADDHLTLDYCVGSHDVVQHISKLAQQNGLANFGTDDE